MKLPSITILESRSNSANVRHVDGVFFRCACCHKVKATSGNGCTTGYAVMPTDELYCFDCADVSQREELKDRSKPFVAYVDSYGENITTWTGGVLARITHRRHCRLTRQSFMHDRRDYSSFRARDCHGQNWYGRGSPGIAIKLRPCK
jgi:hypothetical protein